MARDKLAKDKAKGIDELPDSWLKDPMLWPHICRQIAQFFDELLLNEEEVPKYMKTARVIPLSKDNNTPLYPEEGKVRTIAILPVLTKLYEICLQHFLEQHIQEHNLIHPHQRGFRPGGSCRDNIIDIMQLVN